MLGKVNAMAVAAVLAAGAGGALTAQPAQAQPGVAVPCSTGALASAVASAANDTTLSLAAGCVYNLTAALPEVSQALTITGNSATLQRSYAAGTAAFTILTVTGSGILTVNGLNFRHGAGAIAVVDLGQLTVNGGTFTANAAANGGAIYSDTVIYAPQITGAMFTRNTATGSGGAIYNFSAGASISVSGSVFTENNAANGGAIWEYGIGGSINSSTFRNNSAGTGGALLVSENSGEAFNDVVIRGNSASGDGGGIYVAGGGVGGAFLDDSTVSDNHAGGQGGGLFDAGGETSQVIGSHILGNSAAYGAGIYNDSNAIFRLTGSTVSGNRAATDGGGIYNATEGSAFLTTSTIGGPRTSACNVPRSKDSACTGSPAATRLIASALTP